MTEDTKNRGHITGTLHVVDGTGVVRMESRYDADIDDVWSALTERERLARWIAEVDGDLDVGGVIRATFTSGWAGPGRIDVCEPPRRLLVTMSPGQQDETAIVAELTVEGDQTRLVIEERGFAQGELAAHGAGWQAHVEDLDAHLAGRQCADWRTRWTALSPAYGEQAAVLGSS